MEKKFYNDSELKDIASEIIESLRPKHLTVREIMKIADHMKGLTQCIVLREKPAEEK